MKKPLLEHLGFVRLAGPEDGSWWRRNGGVVLGLAFMALVLVVIFLFG